ncbi:MAG: zincin-like metallopeptidase domain-containing protein [SAR324 cluster bacterium]|nr:zincin-like metallopeptidase domain-containing protein [SAR324 cluster bacterium]
MNAIHNTDQLQVDATALIVEQLKQFETTGKAPKWLQPWNANGSFSWPVNLDGTFYSGINVFVLLALQEKFGFPSATWGTYKAYQAQDAQVQKGERAAKIFFYKSLVINAKDEQGQLKLGDDEQPEQLKIPLLKSFCVFNITQTDLEPTVIEPPSEDFQGLDDVFNAVDIRHGANAAYYDRQGDFVRMPYLEQFEHEASYWVVLAHEIIHWTGAPIRLDRQKGKAFGDEDYAQEELIAELGSVMLLAHFGIQPCFQSSVYINGWIRSLEADHKLIFKIAAQAQRAVNFFLEDSK